MSTAKFSSDKIAMQLAKMQTTKTVTYFNCAGHAQGEKVKQ